MRRILSVVFFVLKLVLLFFIFKFLLLDFGKGSFFIYGAAVVAFPYMILILFLPRLLFNAKASPDDAADDEFVRNELQDLHDRHVNTNSPYYAYKD